MTRNEARVELIDQVSRRFGITQEESDRVRTCDGTWWYIQYEERDIPDYVYDAPCQNEEETDTFRCSLSRVKNVDRELSEDNLPHDLKLD